MAHCSFDQLDDLKILLNEIRTIPKIKEVKPGIFYLKSRGFLHFHINKENERWADIHDGKTWGDPVPLPFNPSKKEQLNFLKIVKERHLKVVSK
jgi:hypothetical protein